MKCENLLRFPENRNFFGMYSILLFNLGQLAKWGGSGYPQVLPKVIILQGMLELPESLIPDWKPTTLLTPIWCEKRRKWVPHRDPVECSGLLTHVRLTHYSYIARDFHTRFDPPLLLVSIFLRCQKDFRLQNCKTFLGGSPPQTPPCFSHHFFLDKHFDPPLFVS